MRPPIKRVGPDSVEITANNYLELAQMLFVLLRIMGPTRGYRHMLRLILSAVWNGQLQVTETGRANYWRMICLILFLQRLISLLRNGQ